MEFSATPAGTLLLALIINSDLVLDVERLSQLAGLRELGRELMKWMGGSVLDSGIFQEHVEVDIIRKSSVSNP